mmetsp:Transcript_23135/g.33897  ORF Transcript_23135/g.33897 Transcript_23135/m.33897 type:complete len:482 (+) Transcript_23135:87-1532(+)
MSGLPVTTHVSLFKLSARKTWDPISDGEWIKAKIWIEDGELKFALSDTESFTLPSAMLVSLIKKSTQWVLVAEDFAEFEDMGGTRYGMYFESETEALDFTAAISAALIEISTGAFSPPGPPSLQAPSEEAGITNAAKQESGAVRRTSVHQTLKNKRRISLAEFQVVDEAVGQCFSQAEDSESGSSADFNQAVDEKIVALRGQEQRRSDEALPPPPGVPEKVTEALGATGCFPSARRPVSMSSAPIDPSVISSPDKTTFKHAVKVVFNEDLSRFEGLPPEWKHQNKQFGVPYESLQKRSVDGYSQSIPTVLVMLKRHLFENNAQDVVGVFRLAPDKDECQAVKTQIDTGEYEGCSDVNILANLIKVFFRELPVNILNNVSDEDIHRIARLSVDETVVEMDRVFGDQHSIVYWLLDLMAEIVINEDVNRMSVKNMAIVMSPNLYAVTSENAMVALTMAQKVAEFTTNILAARLKSKYNYDPRL